MGGRVSRKYPGKTCARSGLDWTSLSPSDSFGIPACPRLLFSHPFFPLSIFRRERWTDRIREPINYLDQARRSAPNPQSDYVFCDKSVVTVCCNHSFRCQLSQESAKCADFPAIWSPQEIRTRIFLSGMKSQHPTGDCFPCGLAGLPTKRFHWKLILH